MRPAISVIGTIFNQKKHAQRTIESWCRQDFDLPYEILVMDDGSTDGSEQMVEELAGKYPNKIRYFYINRPFVTCYVHPMNLGIKKAEADIVALPLGFDRIVESCALQKLYEPHKTNDKIITSLKCRHIGTASSAQLIPEQYLDELLASVDWLNNTELLYKIAGKEDPSYICHINESPCLCVRKKWLCEIGGFDERYLETWNYANPDLWNRLRRYGMEIKLIDASSFHQPHPVAGFTYEERDKPLDDDIVKTSGIPDGYNQDAGRNWKNVEKQKERIDDGSIIRNATIEWGALPYQKEIRYIKSFDEIIKQPVEEKISIVMLSWDRAHLTQTAIETFLKFTKIPFELIVVDNGSKDNTIKMLEKFSDVKVIYNRTNRGFCGGLNQGLDIATGKYILFTQNDLFVGNGWDTGIVNLYKHFPRCGALGVTGGDFKEGKKLIGYHYNGDLVYGFNQDDFLYKNVGYVDGFFILSDTAFLKENNIRWDENYTLFYEDCDFCKQIVVAGRKCYIVSRKLVPYYHMSNATITYNIENTEREKWVAESREYFYKKWI